MLAFDLLAALMALYMLARHGRILAGLLRGPAGAPARARALVPLLTCLVALAVLGLAGRGLLLAWTRALGGLP